MDLSIASLKAAGAFVAPPVKKEITWHVGGVPKKATVYVVQESFSSLVQRWEEQERGGDLTAQRIASCICDKDGKPVFSVADVMGNPETGHGPLTATLTIVLLNAIGEVNNATGETSEKKSARRKSSGTSSSSAVSAGERSRKPKQTSAT
jgi:hypothetical protein